MNEQRIDKMVRDMQINQFLYGKVYFPKSFYKLNDQERAEVIKRVKRGDQVWGNQAKGHQKT